MNADPSSSLPDMQNRDAAEILGANVAILQVGISNFRLPLQIATADGSPVSVEASITGTVSLDKDRKGINMSRIMRIFYDHQSDCFTPDTLETILREYQEKINSSRAQLTVRFSFPTKKDSLRSGLSGFQYYECAYEGILDENKVFSKKIHFDFVYSSACPCSSELSEHALDTRGVYAIPHSQRSKARLWVKLKDSATLSLEEIQSLCSKALVTETQVMVKREDEQAFAELNGQQIKFVEDAARLIFQPLDSHPAIEDFQVAIAHLESLHSHDAVAVITKGIPNGFNGQFEDFRNLIC